MERVQLGILHRKLTQLGFAGWDGITEVEVLGGVLHVYALFLRHILQFFGCTVAGYVRKYEWLCMEKDDAALGQSVLRLMREEFGYRSPLTAQQFARMHFAQAKLKICLDLIEYLRSAAKKQRLAERRAGDALQRICELAAPRDRLPPQIEGSAHAPPVPPLALACCHIPSGGASQAAVVDHHDAVADELYQRLNAIQQRRHQLNRLPRDRRHSSGAAAVL